MHEFQTQGLFDDINNSKGAGEVMIEQDKYKDLPLPLKPEKKYDEADSNWVMIITIIMILVVASIIYVRLRKRKYEMTKIR